MRTLLISGKSIQPKIQQNYLNRLWYSKLHDLGYIKRNKILSIKQLELIKEIWGDFDCPDE